MNTPLARFLLAVLIALPLPGMAAGLPPWKFGMSKAEVVSFKEFAPYKEFKNGDVETFAGKFHGQKENIQFFFENGRLQRIGVYLSEGRDIKQAMKAWQRAYGLLKADYGLLATPGIKTPVTGDPANVEELAIAAGANTDASGKTDTTPVKQPDDMLVSLSFLRADVAGAKFYYVVVSFDPRPQPKVAANRIHTSTGRSRLVPTL